MKIPISVLVLIHNLNRDVLLIERADRPDFWQSVTGSLDSPDESLEVAAIREVAEETGIDVHALPKGALQNLHHQVEYEIYPKWRHRYPPGVVKNTEHCFKVELPARVPVTLAAKEHVDFRWEPISVASSLCFSPSNQEAISKLKIK